MISERCVRYWLTRRRRCCTAARWSPTRWQATSSKALPASLWLTSPAADSRLPTDLTSCKTLLLLDVYGMHCFFVSFFATVNYIWHRNAGGGDTQYHSFHYWMQWRQWPVRLCTAKRDLGWSDGLLAIQDVTDAWFSGLRRSFVQQTINYNCLVK